MQNKGLVKFFAIIFALVSIYQLSFTFVTNHYEDKAKAFAGGDSTKELQYLDSIGNQTVFLGQTFNEVRAKQINKGLDLEGGINVTLQISIKDILKGLANNSKNATFNKALAEAESQRQGNQSYLDAFYTAFDKESKGNVKLAAADIFANRNLSEITVGMSDSQVKSILDKKVKESIESAYRVFRERIDKFGVSQPNIQMLGDTGRILVELPGAKDVDRIKNLLQSTAQLEFWETYKVDEIGNYIMAANEYLKTTEKQANQKETATDNTTTNSDVEALLGTVAKDSMGNAANKEFNPLLDLFAMGGQQGSPILGYFQTKDTVKVNAYLNRADVRNLLPADQKYARFAWGKPSKKAPDLVELYALKTNREGIPPLSGSVITGAQDEYDQFSRPVVGMTMSPKGAKVWEELTGKAYTEHSNIAIVLDNIVYSAPGVTSGPISGGRSSISGDFTVADAKDLANILRAGKLPAGADIVQSEIVGPSLGQQAIDAGMLSAVAGLIIVAAWMAFYYGRAGWYANIALLANLLFLFGILASLGAVLTLPGIAGIVLTMGTAVDANIIISERAKECLRKGMSLADTIKESYSWHGAMRPIVDANVTHILTGVILFAFGSGPIKGFATTLLIGIATSLFTSIFIARIFMDRDVKAGRTLAFSTNITKNWFTNFNFDFLKMKKATYGLSLIIVVVSFASFAINGFDQGTDFVGGRTFQVKFDKEVTANEVSDKLGEVFGVNVEAKVFGNKQQLKLTTKYKVEEEGAAVDQEVNEKLYEGLKGYYSSPMTYEEFVNATEGKTLGVIQASKVGPSMAKDVKQNAYWAVLGSMAAIFIYLVISFRKWQYSLGAIVSVAHDVIFVLGIYSLTYKFMPWHMEIDQHFIAAILTVIGYSMNDTVIVFDRVREYIAGKTKGDFNKIVNDSVNTTLSRTINTSLTLILVLLIMFVFGGDSIRGFIFAMLIGIIVGTYSSLFLATPVLVDTMPRKDKEEIERRHKEAQEEMLVEKN
ncbi:protein-export membrane protein SecD [Myroides odoratimimus CCUG 12901]|uniref:protein translocase subunit SecDF n=1 Tax=Myroides odoratimimus TaxID=76832 RepID=UPI000246072B|nr:protein translocase subunit SecDF [Myroides odoratimimus]EHO11363.1 protein-export membrane protein SecD [Myroides odoratimimus CCUG 12901]MCO7724245.1 protein translocase subunit SecDF [Myroides odoratimimus]MDM1411775.1 protein translocase subunit SecDF [Myroides odoratimimus]MDM1443887.1 protein translocase subunit SecDF [Myroides odoratimimus]MDM1451418.1 protein translocase subunit SecDF [Myroides odoratimimus]